jgi:hypothetical protein
MARRLLEPETGQKRLSPEALKVACDLWAAGDVSHLPEHMQDRTRIGVYFPKTAELRVVAEHWMASREKQARDREKGWTREAHDAAVAAAERRVAEELKRGADRPRAERGDLAVAIERVKHAVSTAPVIRTHAELSSETVVRMSPNDLRALAAAIEAAQRRAEQRTEVAS